MDNWIINIKQYLNLKEMEKSWLMVEKWKLRKIEEFFFLRGSILIICHLISLTQWGQEGNLLWKIIHWEFKFTLVGILAQGLLREHYNFWLCPTTPNFGQKITLSWCRKGKFQRKGKVVNLNRVRSSSIQLVDPRRHLIDDLHDSVVPFSLSKIFSSHKKNVLLHLNCQDHWQLSYFHLFDC
jgi:hypothetical protein